MIILHLALILVLTFSAFHFFAGKISKSLEDLSKKDAPESCPSALSDYWLQSTDPHCVPPAMDHGAHSIPYGSSAMALCAYLNELDGDDFIREKERNYECSYL